MRRLGTAQKLAELVSESPGRPLWAEEREFDATAALWDLARSLRLVETVDRRAPKRRQGARVGEYMVLATVNRVVDPESKSGPAAWYRQTVLARLLPLPAGALRSQRFWDHMQYLDEASLLAVEADLTRHVVEDPGVDLRALFYDTTNFDTFLCSESASRPARHGHAK